MCLDIQLKKKGKGVNVQVYTYVLSLRGQVLVAGGCRGVLCDENTAAAPC